MPANPPSTPPTPDELRALAEEVLRDHAQHQWTGRCNGGETLRPCLPVKLARGVKEAADELRRLSAVNEAWSVTLTAIEATLGCYGTPVSAELAAQQLVDENATLRSQLATATERAEAVEADKEHSIAMALRSIAPGDEVLLDRGSMGCVPTTWLNNAERRLTSAQADVRRLDWLEAQAARTHLPDRGWIARLSIHGRGYRLHETTMHGHQPTARAAIDSAMGKEEGDGQ